MPDSQENDWRALGFTNEFEFIESSFDWEAATERFQQAIEEFRRIGPVVIETARSMREITPFVEEPMINLKQADYPRWDGYNTYWFSAYAIYDFNGGNCFVCGVDTNRMDIMLGKLFCDSSECNASLTT